MSLAYAFALLLPLCAGVALYAACLGIASSERCNALGYGTVLGLLLAAGITSLCAHADTARAWQRGTPWLIAMTVAAAVYAWRSRGKRCAPGTPAPAEGAWRLAVPALLCATLVLRAVMILREIWLRPLYPWDAWTAWAVKGKVWYLLGHQVAFGTAGEWLADQQGNVHTMAAWFYPDALAWLDVWLASAAGGWIEPLLNLPWLLVWVAVLLGNYGQWRALGLRRERALWFAYLLGSLPLLTVHAALAGYMDIWVAALFGFSFLSWMRWLQQRDRAQLILAMLCAAVLPWLKLEGAVWAVGLFLAVGFAALPVRWRWRVVACALFAAVAFGLGGLRFVFVKLGWVNAAGAVVNPALGQFGLLVNMHWHGEALPGAFETLYAHGNWHLLWWALPVVVAWRWRELVAREWLWLPALLLAVCLCALLFLFTLTDAVVWAQSFTAINRLALQLTPAIVSLLAMLLRDAWVPQRSCDTAPAPDPHCDPA